MVASCQGCPPCASGMYPAALIFAEMAMSSSKVLGGEIFSSSKIFLFAQIQLVRWMFTGAVTHGRLAFDQILASGAGAILPDHSLLARLERSPRVPASGWARPLAPSVCMASGGCPLRDYADEGLLGDLSSVANKE